MWWKCGNSVRCKGASLRGWHLSWFPNHKQQTTMYSCGEGGFPEKTVVKGGASRSLLLPNRLPEQHICIFSYCLPHISSGLLNPNPHSTCLFGDPNSRCLFNTSTQKFHRCYKISVTKSETTSHPTHILPSLLFQVNYTYSINYPATKARDQVIFDPLFSLLQPNQHFSRLNFQTTLELCTLLPSSQPPLFSLWHQHLWHKISESQISFSPESTCYTVDYAQL